MALTAKQQAKIKECYDARNWLCIGMWIIMLGRLVLDYIKELKNEKQNGK